LEFQYFAEFRFQALSCHAHGALKQITEGGALERNDAKLGKQLLLANAEPKSALAESGVLGLCGGLDHRVLSVWR
jgi:hypothetical protein